MKDWEKILKRAPKDDKDRIEEAINLLEQHIFPVDTIKLKGQEQYRTRIGKWRIIFHYEDSILRIDKTERRDGHNY